MNDLNPFTAKSRAAGGQVIQPAQFGGDGEQIPLFSQYLRIALRWKKVIIASIIVSLLISLAATIMMTPQYTASATVEISREGNQVVEVGGVEQETSSADLEFYQTQYGLLQSRSLAEEVARALKLVDNPAFFDMFGESDDILFADPDRRLSAAERSMRERKAAEILLRHISIEPVRLSRLVNIKFTSPDADLSANVVNSWTQNFISSTLERRFEATSYARTFLEERLEQLRERLAESERALVAYASNQEIINLPASSTNGVVTSGERSLLADDLARLNAELGDATADRIQAQSRWNQASRSGPGAVAEALQNTAISGLRQKRAELSSDYERMMVQFEPDYPPARALASQIAQLDRSIAREEARVAGSFRTAYQESLNRERALSERVDSLKGGLLDLRRRSIQYNIFQRDVDTNRELYDGLLQRYKEIGVAGGVGTNNVAIVDPANVPDQPSSPILLLNLVLGILAGVVIGGVLTFILEQSDEAIADPTEIERELNVPLLGAIPKSIADSPIEAMQDRKSELVEAYLSVQTNLEFATTHGVPRSISVTSTRASEGKSTSAFALATSFARARKKVILIDGDMRSPSVHGMLGLSNERGLSNFLSGNDDVASLIQPVGELSAITAGPTPPNAAELLTGERLPELIALLLERYDHVVIDSPPVLGLADAPLIGSRVEGTVFAVESHKIRVSLVRVALSRLANANVRILGALLTKFEAKRAGYGYDYGYGYGAAGHGKPAES